MPVDRFPSDADFERLLRQQYAPLCTDHDYQRLRRKCGLGPVIDGETVTSTERTPAMTDQPDPELSIIAVEITHPQGYANHEFEYEPHTDLFRCVLCRRYEVSLRDHTTGHIQPCTGPTTQEDTDQ